jgi:glycosyltransferase involved in cell wall biosynthesis
MVLIPAFQAGKYLQNVLSRVKAVFPQPEDIWVVDDGSSDATGQIAQNAGVQVLRHSENRGKGAALRTGFAQAIADGYDFVLILDADGQHNPIYIPKFVDAFATGRYDIVIGTRVISPKSMPFDRYLSNSYSSLVASVAAGRRIRDSQSGYRLLSVNLLKGLRLRSKKYETESEILIQAVRFLKARVGEIPIQVTYGGEESHIHRVTDTLRFVRIVLKTLGMV